MKREYLMWRKNWTIHSFIFGIYFSHLIDGILIYIFERANEIVALYLLESDEIHHFKEQLHFIWLMYMQIKCCRSTDS